jgi:Tfp pilus assembly PilM family ATPase
MYIPPFTSMVAPVTNEERSEARNKKMFPISVGLAIRPIGIELKILSKIS